MPFAYTVCSLNHVPFALALGRSILKHDPDSRFFIGIVDRIDGRVELPQIENITYIEVDELGIDGFDEMCRNYSIFELCCASKPFFAKYILDSFAEVERLMYFDTDILVFSSLNELDAKLGKCNILLTPHITIPLEPSDETLFPNDENFTGAGVYNGGFLGISRTEESFRFLEWWSQRLRTKARIQFEKGIFVDQSWLSLAPLFFHGVHIELGPQFNVAYWNLHERKLSERDGKYFVNDEPLVFYHFSGFRIGESDRISIYQNRCSFNDQPVLSSIFDHYLVVVKRERLNDFVDLRPAFGPTRLSVFKRKLKAKIENQLRHLD